MPTDTSAEASRAQAEALRKLGSGRRFEIACELSVAVRELARARIKAKHPDWSDIEIRDQLTWELYGVRRRPG